MCQGNFFAHSQHTGRHYAPAGGGITMADIETLPIDRIATEDTQARVTLSDTIIREYAEGLTRGDVFPPIDVFFDGEAYWLADCFHRVKATREAGRDTISATVHQRGKR